MDADLRSAVSMSHLRELPAEVLDNLLVGSARMRISAGSVTHWEGQPDPHLELVVSGVVRVFVTAPDGRTMTVLPPWRIDRGLVALRDRLRDAGHHAGACGRRSTRHLRDRRPSHGHRRPAGCPSVPRRVE